MGIDLRIMVQMVSGCINSTSTQKIQYNANGLQIKANKIKKTKKTKKTKKDKKDKKNKDSPSTAEHCCPVQSSASQYSLVPPSTV